MSSLTLKRGEEPVPGYRLVEKIGAGGFGEVWRAIGPGGVACALKFLGLQNNQGLREYRALKLVQNIRHSFLIPLFGFWLLDGNGQVLDETASTVNFKDQDCTLIIAMGLGSKCLAGRLSECQKLGLPGIPIDELMHYMGQAAAAIDFLNKPIHHLGKTGELAALRHGDIKPGNMLLVANDVQLCDFGLASILRGTGPMRTTASLPMFSPAYVAPEIVTYRGPSLTGDQFSLAVSYVELRSGRLPYETDNAGSIVALVACNDIVLDFLGTAEQNVLRRALALKPEDRYATCAELVRALQEVHGSERVTYEPAAFQIRNDQPAKVRSDRWVKPPIPEELFTPQREVISGYRLEKLLGKGEYGETWRALGPGKTKVALKVVKDLSGLSGQQTWAALETIKDELDHPHLMKMQAFWLLDAYGEVIPDEERESAGGRKPAYLIILTELAGKNLERRLEECASEGMAGIPPAELLRYVTEAAKALDYLGARSHKFADREGYIVHRNIKPENLLLTRSDDIKVCDFGLAKLLEGSLANVSTNRAGLTPYYAAPELLRKQFTRWTDQYSLAVAYYHLRTGRLPIDPKLEQIEQWRRIKDGRLDLSGLTEPEAAVIARATKVEPTERFATCSEMVRELSAAFDPIGGSPVPPRDEPSRAIPRPVFAPPANVISGRGLRMVVGTTLLLGLVALGILFAMRPSKPDLVPIAINVDPVDASVTFLGVGDPPTNAELPGHYAMPKVAREIRIDAPGYHSRTETIDPSATTEYAFRLERQFVGASEPETSEIKLTVAPNAATISVVQEGFVSVLSGKQPDGSYRVRREPFRIRIEADGFKATEAVIDARSRLEYAFALAKIDVAPTPVTERTVRIETVPPGASVTVIGRPRPEPKATPADYVLPVEATVILLRKAGFEPVRHELRRGTEPPVRLVLERSVQIENTINMTLRWIKPGKFVMGSPAGEVGGQDGIDRPIREVTISRGFYMGKFEVTQAQYLQVMGQNRNPSNPAKSGEEDRRRFPVNGVSHANAVEFVKRLNDVESGKRYRLPTEAEWEYACRAGTSGPFSVGATLSWGDAVFDATKPFGPGVAARGPAPTVPAAVGSVGRPNGFGLHDMHGNLWEWVADWHGPYVVGAVRDPKGPLTGDQRVVRGGSYRNAGVQCRSSSRDSEDPNVPSDQFGFRIVLDADE